MPPAKGQKRSKKPVSAELVVYARVLHVIFCAHCFLVPTLSYLRNQFLLLQKLHRRRAKAENLAPSNLTLI
jgi:hypothetical protein